VQYKLKLGRNQASPVPRSSFCTSRASASTDLVWFAIWVAILMYSDLAMTFLGLGPGRYCWPRHRWPFNLINKGSTALNDMASNICQAIKVVVQMKKRSFE